MLYIGYIVTCTPSINKSTMFSQSISYSFASIKLTRLPEKKKAKLQFRNYIRAIVQCFPDRSCDSIFMDNVINNSVLSDE